MKNEGMNHGLFGKLSPGTITQFEDWKEVAKLVYSNSKKHITMYRSVISFQEDVAKELLLHDQASWQRYIENHILTIAEKNNIKREHLQWACAVHPEKSHPHIHVAFWDNSSSVRNPFTHPSIPNAIRKQMIKDTFADKIKEFAEQKNRAVKNLREISDELVDAFESHLRRLDRKAYQRFRNSSAEERELSGVFEFEEEGLDRIADMVNKIKNALPEKGRIAYQLLPANVKIQVDQLVNDLKEQYPSIKELHDDYVQSKMKMVALYGDNQTYQQKRKEEFEAEADKIIANRILGMVKTLNRLDSEMRTAEYMEARNHFYMEQMLFEILDMLSAVVDQNEEKGHKVRNNSNLSKEARKEYYLKYQDRGYEH